jgi:hypothetical protein
MKTSSLCLSLFLSVALVASCTSEDDKSPGGTGGASGKGGSGGSGSGGSTPGSGGSAVGTGGTGTGGGTGGGSGGAPGTGGSGTGGAPAGSGGAKGDAGGGSETGSTSDMASSAGGPAAALNFVFDVPCPPATVRPAGNCNWGMNGDDPARKKSVALQFGGDPTKTYAVKLKVCAVSEQRSYTGCMAGGAGSNFVCMDGNIGGPATYPAVSMVVAEPMHTYYLNNGGLRDNLAKMEYSATFQIKGGTMVTIATNGGGNPDVYTATWRSQTLQCAGAPGIMQPFPGQFFWFTVESATEM